MAVYGGKPKIHHYHIEDSITAKGRSMADKFKKRTRWTVEREEGKLVKQPFFRVCENFLARFGPGKRSHDPSHIFFVFTKKMSFPLFPSHRHVCYLHGGCNAIPFLWRCAEIPPPQSTIGPIFNNTDASHGFRTPTS